MKRNPTLVHHGMSHGASFHLYRTVLGKRQAVADIYGNGIGKGGIKSIGQFFANQLKARVFVDWNSPTPHTLADHVGHEDKPERWVSPGGRGKKNPRVASWHVVNTSTKQPVADFYFENEATARGAAQTIARKLNRQLALIHVAESLCRHEVAPPNDRRKPKRNPGPSPVAGETWIGKLDGQRDRVLEVAGTQLRILHTETGNRETVDAREFVATHRPARRTNPPRAASDTWDVMTPGGIHVATLDNMTRVQAAAEAARLEESSGESWLEVFSNTTGKMFRTNPRRRLVTLQGASLLAARLVETLGFKAAAKEIRDGKATAIETLRWLKSMKPHGHRGVLVAVALDQLEREAAGLPTGVTGEQMQAIKSAAIAAYLAEREGRRPNPTFHVTGTVTTDDPPAPETATAADVVVALEAAAETLETPAPARRGKSATAKSGRVFEFGTWVTVPYMGRDSYFGRGVKKSRERARVDGMSALADGTPAVLVSIPRGTGYEQHTVALSQVRKAPKSDKRPFGDRMAAEITELVKKYQGRAHVLEASIAKVQQEIEEAYDQLRDLYPQAGEKPSKEYAYRRTRFGALKKREQLLAYVANQLAGFASDADEPWAAPVSMNPRHNPGPIDAGTETPTFQLNSRGGNAVVAAWPGGVRPKMYLGQPQALAALAKLPDSHLFEVWRPIRGRAYYLLLQGSLGSKSRTGNPRAPFGEGASELERAEKMFRTWHEFDSKTIKTVKIPRQTFPKYGVNLGEIVTIDYVSDKWEGKPVTYTHDTKRPRPLLVSDPDGKMLFIVGGKMKPTADGLVN